MTFQLLFFKRVYRTGGRLLDSNIFIMFCEMTAQSDTETIAV
jgi:hypothetical protein